MARSILVAVLVMMWSANAWAQAAGDKPDGGLTSGPRTKQAQAQAYRAEGEAFVKSDDCRSAIDPLRSAWALQNEAKTAVLLGECEVKLSQEPEAAHHLARALDLLPDGAERSRIEAMFQDVSSRVGRLEVTVNEPKAVVIVDKFVVSTPVEHFFVAPGDVTVTVKKNGFVEELRDIRVVAGKTEHLSFVLKRKQRESELDHPERTAAMAPMTPAYVASGAAVFSVVLGLVLLNGGKPPENNAKLLLSKLELDLGSPPCAKAPKDERCADLSELLEEHDRFVNTSTGLFVTGGLLFGAATVYAMVTSRKTRQEFALVPVVSPSSHGLLLQGRF